MYLPGSLKATEAASVVGAIVLVVGLARCSNALARAGDMVYVCMYVYVSRTQDVSEQVVSKGITGWNGRQVVVELTDVAGVV